MTLHTRQLSFDIFPSSKYYYTLTFIPNFDLQALNLKDSSVFLFIDEVTFSFFSEDESLTFICLTS